MDVIILPNGERAVLRDFKDLLELIGTYIGDDARKWLEVYVNDLEADIREEYE